MNYLGGASGAALGYIVGNIPGAAAGGYYGYQLGSKRPGENMEGEDGLKKNRYSKFFPKMSRTRPLIRTYAGRYGRNPFLSRGTPRRITPRSRMSTPRARRIVRGRSRRMRARPFRTGHTSGVRKFMRGNRKRKVFVSNKLRKKIRKVVYADKLKGFHQEIGYDVIVPAKGTDIELDWSNAQVVKYAGTVGAGSLGQFTPRRILDAASVLWNDKAMSALGADKNLGATGNFDPKKVKIRVLKSGVTYNIKNNTDRGMHFKLIECQARNDSVLGEPIGVWNALMVDQAADDRANQGNVSINQLGLHPSLIPGFDKLFKTATTKLHLEAGANYSYYMKGPSDVLYDYTKIWNGSAEKVNNKHTKWLIIVTWPELVHGDINGTITGGRTYGTAESENEALVFEEVIRHKLSMPEMTGFDGVGTTGSNQLNNRQFAYAMQTYSGPIPQTVIEMNPEFGQSDV